MRDRGEDLLKEEVLKRRNRLQFDLDGTLHTAM